MQALGLAQGLAQDAPVQVVEAVGVDTVGVGQVLAALQLVLLHAGLLDEVVGLFIGGAIEGINHLAGDQFAQALQGVVGTDAIGQGQQACAIDEGGQALDLEVEGGCLVIAFAGQHELAEASNGRPLAQGVLGHHALEQAVVGDLLENALAQLLAGILIAPDHAQVEVDA
ncbi:hypothetical protein D3C77_291630 [compost metagenome]